MEEVTGQGWGLQGCFHPLQGRLWEDRRPGWSSSLPLKCPVTPVPRPEPDGWVERACLVLGFVFGVGPDKLVFAVTKWGAAGPPLWRGSVSGEGAERTSLRAPLSLTAAILSLCLGCQHSGASLIRRNAQQSSWDPVRCEGTGEQREKWGLKGPFRVTAAKRPLWSHQRFPAVSNGPPPRSLLSCELSGLGPSPDSSLSLSPLPLPPSQTRSPPLRGF